MGAARQDEVLAAAEAGLVRAAWPVSPTAFFDALLALTNEGYYGGADGHDDEDPIGWKMIGYRPGTPDGA